MLHDDEIKLFFNKNSLFIGLNEDRLKDIYSISKELYLKKGDYLIHEGEKAAEIFFVIAGDLEVEKKDSETGDRYVVNILHAGDTAGELALIDKGLRSASLRALTDIRILRIAFDDLERLSKESRDFASIFHEIYRRVSRKLRETTEVCAIALKRESEEYQNRTYMGRLLIYTILLLSFLAFSIPPLQYFLSLSADNIYVTIPLIVILAVYSLAVMKESKFPLSFYGVTTNNWEKSVFEGIVFTLPILGLVVLIKWVSIHVIPERIGEELFNKSLISNITSIHWFIFNGIYWLFVPVQELMVRGVVQGLLERFLIGKRKVLISIVASNLVFSIGHIFIAEDVSLVVFLMGLYFGWLYSRTHCLIGVIIAHCLVGTWGFSVLGT